MKTFLEVENKMGLMIPIPAPNGQFRPPLLEMNPYVHKNDNTDKRKRATPKRKLKPIAPRVAMMCPPLPQVPPQPSNNMLSTLVQEDTPWPSAGKTSGNLFKDRNWLLPKGYLAHRRQEGGHHHSFSEKRNQKLKIIPAAQRKRNVVGVLIALL